MSFFTQNSWFASTQADTQAPDFSQDLFTTQDCLLTANNFSQSQNLTLPSQFNSQPYRAKIFSNQTENANGNDDGDINESKLSQYRSQFSMTQRNHFDQSFDAKTQAEWNFLHENSQFIFNGESEEIEVCQESVDEAQKSQIASQAFVTQRETQISQQAPSTLSQSLSKQNGEESDEQGSEEDSVVIAEDSSVPELILQMFKDVKKHYSDMTFVSTLAGYLCTDSFPMGAYFNLKLSLLLSIVSVGQSQPIAIVAVGSETSHASTIMSSIGRFAQRLVKSTFMVFDAPTSNQVEAGPLHMAKDGILSIGEWSLLPPKTSRKLLREIETGRVVTESVQDSVPLECAVWTCWSCSTNIKKDSSSINQFMNVFGIPIMIEDFPSDDDILDDLFNLTTDIIPSVSDDDMRDFLSFVGKQHVRMEPQANEMLRDYFEATRMIRPNALTPKAFEVLQEMAKAHAKLCLRNVVNELDVLAAVNISEKYIRVFFDKDSYSSPDEPKFTSMDEIDDFYYQLQSWFTSFTQNILRRQI